MTAFGNMTGHWQGNMTAGNMTQSGNMTPPQATAGNGNTNGFQNQNDNNAGTGITAGQAQDNSVSQNQNDSDLIAAFLKWLKGQ
jgi:hypothetical protein